MNRLLAGILGLTFLTTVAGAVQPARFNYQAKLTDGAGAPLSGNHTMFFSLFQGGNTTSGGTQVFKEQAVVSATNGVVNHTVGTGTNLAGGALNSAMLNFSGDIFLQVAVDTEPNVVLPRARLEPVPFAIEAANGVPSGTSILTPTSNAVSGFINTGMTLSGAGTWMEKSTMPGVGYYVAGSAAGGKFHVLAGIADGLAQQINLQYDPVTNAWAERDLVPTARVLPAAAGYNGKVYLVGGMTISGVALATHEVYDVGTNSWQAKSTMPTARGAATLTEVGGKLYCIGGGANVNVATNEVYDVSLNMWTTMADMPTSRSNAVAGAINGKIYVVGGSLTQVSSDVSALTEEYTVASNTWTRKADLPIAIKLATSAVINNRLFVFGGLDASFVPQTNVYEYDPAVNSWTAKATLLAPAGANAAGVVSGRTYIAGGITATGGTNQYESRLFEFTPAIFFVQQRN